MHHAPAATARRAGGTGTRPPVPSASGLPATDTRRSVLSPALNQALNPALELLRPYRRVAGRVVGEQDAAELLRAALLKRAQPFSALSLEPVGSGSDAVDPYGPHEAGAGLSRACLQVLHELRQPVGVTTRHQLLLHETDLLRAMAAQQLVRVVVPLSSLRAQPRQRACPASRLHMIYRLAGAGVPVGVRLRARERSTFEAEFHALLEAASGAGARWIELSRDGSRSPSRNDGRRARGSARATDWEQVFQQPLQLACARLGLETKAPALDASSFRVRLAPRQLEFF